MSGKRLRFAGGIVGGLVVMAGCGLLSFAPRSVLADENGSATIGAKIHKADRDCLDFQSKLLIAAPKALPKSQYHPHIR